MVPLLLAAALQTVQPAEVKSFGRWSVGCDNGRACRAVSLLGHEDEEVPPMALDRGPERQARPVLTFPGRADRCTSFAMFVDGKRLAQSLDLGCGAARAQALAAATDAVVAAMRSSDRLQIRDRSGKLVAHYSLTGAAAALRYMDSVQRRVGTVTALVALGSRPASAVPAPPPLPVVREVRPARPGKGPPLARALVGTWRARHRCERVGNQPEPSYRLDDSHFLFVIVCQGGSRDLWPMVLTATRRDGRDARPARFDYDSSYGEGDPAPTAPVNASWDVAKGRLTSGWSGECGFVEEWAWDGSRFRLAEHVEMVSGTIDRFSRNCSSGLDFWIPTWRARVVRARGR
ncbi:MAG TPA: DUF1176 domain-containing protein [Allosphingosinicella sp.]|jgi:hypothetical protein